MANPGFRLGIEVETLLVRKDTKNLPEGNELDVFAKALAKKYNEMRDAQKNFSMRADVGRKYQGVEYQDWVLTDDITIRGDEDKYFLIEIVSPILKASPSQNRWRLEITDLFKHIGSLCAFQTNRSCGFHVHLSPIGGSWSLSELQGISVAIIHFECAFEALIPETRRGNQFIRSNRFFGNPALLDKRHSEVIHEILKQKTVKSLAVLMSPNRYTAWNFENLKEDDRKGSLEFRQPPGQTHASGCLVWIELAINFVQSARRPNWYAQIGDYTQTVAGLQKFTKEGFVQGISQERYMVPLFNSREGTLQKMPKYPEYPERSLMWKKEKEDKKKNILMAKLKEDLKREVKKSEK